MRERAHRGGDRIGLGARAEDRQEHGLRVGRADARLVELVRDQRLDAAADQRPVADLAVVHEQPAPIGERVAVRPRRRRAGRGAHMREEQMRADVAAEMAQVLVRPGRPHLAIEPGLGVLRVVPAEPEAVAIGRGVALQRAHALHDERMRGRRDVALELDGFTAIGDPAAHRSDSFRRHDNAEQRLICQSLSDRKFDDFGFREGIYRCRQTKAALTT